MSANLPKKVLCVCLGNICRSPTAEAVLRQAVGEAGLDIKIDSAGTRNWHCGKPPDPRSQHHARLRGLDLSGLRARQVQPGDFESFDLILAMDRQNLHDLRQMASQLAVGRPRAQLALYLEQAASQQGDDVADPYHGGAAGFEQVLDACEQGATQWVRQWQKQRQSAGQAQPETGHDD